MTEIESKRYAVLSLDVSSSSTGWCYTENGRVLISGTIKIKPKFSKVERLVIFHDELKSLLNRVSPTHIVIEDTFAARNINTLKTLSEFAGVAKFTCKSITGIDPYVISNKTVKSFFNAYDKKDLFEFLSDILGEKTLTYSKDNDRIDSTAQLMCFCQEIIELYTYRIEKEYGFEYFNEDIDKLGDIDG